MLSFEISIIDIVLGLAIGVLLILYITKQSTRSVAEPELPVPKEEDAEKLPEAVETQKSAEEKSRYQNALKQAPKNVLTILDI
ncbi:MAG: hypothetical protein JSV12_02240 [Candidatus Bathyarchaeota archaeon]|nr:MAG: hypothetical protein JSV12_02240 [Candidatus Bathyarchaeota archaeon]